MCPITKTFSKYGGMYIVCTFVLVYAIVNQVYGANTNLIVNQVLQKIAFGSCADEEKTQTIWPSIINYNPQLFLFLGDNVYGDKTHGISVREEYLEKSLLDSYYLAEKKQSEFNRLRGLIPHMVTWDDHDYGKNDVGANLPFKETSKDFFMQFWNVKKNDKRWLRDGIYYSQIFGPVGKRVQIIVLDTRWFRSDLKVGNSNTKGRGPYLPNFDKTSTILGSTQWSWLSEKLSEEAEIRFIVSSIQIMADQHRWEKWGNFPHEKQKLYQLLNQKHLRNIIFITGDRHFGAIYREKLPGGGARHEITASSLTNGFRGREIDDPLRVGKIYPNINFGTAEIDWEAEKITLTIRDQNGSPKIQGIKPLIFSPNN